MSEISAAARLELVLAVGERYREGTTAAKRRILDEFVALTRYHRKHAIRLLNGGTGTAAATTRGRLKLYDEAVRQALIVFWEASDRICGAYPLSPEARHSDPQWRNRHDSDGHDDGARPPEAVR
jgi:hypothetical protein